jgi:hypothetical protein
MLMLIALGVDKLGEGLSMDGVATVIDNNRELIPTLYPKLVELMKLLTSMTGNEEWNALAPWRRERR